MPPITQEGITAFLETLRRLPIQIERREALWLWQATLPLAREHRLPDPTGTAYTTSRTPAQVSIRPNHLRDANLPVNQRSTERWFDVSAFAAPTPGFYGTAAKGVIKGPGSEIVHVGLAKQFRITESLRLRWEITGTNFFNTPNWNNPGTSITSVAGAGVITGSGGEQDLDAAGSRNFRMGVRLEW